MPMFYPPQVPAVFLTGIGATFALKELCAQLENQVDIENCTLHSLTHWKEKLLPRHEYLVAHISLSDDENTLWRDMKIERTVAKGDVNWLTSVSTKAPALDVAGIHLDWESFQDNIVETLNFEEARVPLSDFTTLLSLVTPLRPHYNVLEHQCYWFCWVIKEAARLEWGCNIEKGTAYGNAGRLGGSSILLETPKLLEELRDSFHNMHMEQSERSGGQLLVGLEVVRAENLLETEAAVEAERERGKAAIKAAVEAEREKWEAAMRAEREEHRAEMEKLEAAFEKASSRGRAVFHDIGLGTRE